MVRPSIRRLPIKQVILNYRSGDLEVVDVPAPAPKAGTVLVANSASLISAGTERALVDLASSSLIGKAKQRPDQARRVIEKARTDGILEAYQQAMTRLDTDVPLGYSSAGYVVDPGTATNLSRLQPVACAGQGFASHAEIIRVPENLCIPIPDGVDHEKASFVMLGAIAMHGVRSGGAALGEHVAVIGLGLLGQIAVQLLKAAGCRVLAIDPVAHKVELAKRFGADEGVSPEEAVGASLDKVIDQTIITAASASNDPLELATELTRTGGKIVAVGATKLDVPRNAFFEKELSLVVPRASGPGALERDYEEKGIDYPVEFVRWTQRRNMEAFLDLLAAGKVVVDPLVTHRFAIESAGDAYAALKTDPSAIAVILKYAGSPEPTRRTEIPAADRRPIRSAQKEVSLGVIGAGLFSRTTLLPALKEIDGVRLHTICATTGHTSTDLGRKFGFSYSSTDADAVISAPDIDAVLIATRHDSHAGLAAQALRSGKHVFVEKPMALDEVSLRQLENAMSETLSERVFMVGFNRRFAPFTAKASEWFAPGAPVVVQCRINAGHVPSESWVQDSAEGGGRILGEVCHFIDLVHGLSGSLTKRVFAESLPVGEGMHSDNLVVTIQLDDGSVASITYTAGGAKAIAREIVEVHGQGRSAVIENFRKLTLAGPGGTKRSGNPLKIDRGYDAELSAFVGAILSGAGSPITFQDYVRTTKATFAIEESLRRGEPVSIDDLTDTGSNES